MAGDYTSAPGVWQNVSVTPGSGDALSCSLALGHPGPTVPVPTRYVRCPNPSFWEKTTPVAVKIKLKRMGKIHAPYYRIIVADARTKRDGRAIEEIGKYHPKAEPSFIEVDSARAQHWLSVGAQPTDPVRKILEITGDWQKFKGLPGTEGTLKIAEPKANKKDLFASVVAETLGAGAASQKAKARKPGARGADGDQAEAGAGTAKAGAGRPGKTASAAKADTKADTAKTGAKADTAKADTAKADATKADAKADTAKADTAKTKAKVDTAEADAAQAAGSADADTSEAGAAEAAAESDGGA